MPTIVSKTIGTGGDYSTLQAWEDAAPANLVAADQVWRGLVKNQTFTSASTVLVVSGSTTDSTRYKELTTEAGASFIDNIGSAALRYDASKGAAIEITGNYSWAVQIAEDNFRLSKLQIRSTSGGSYAVYSGNSSNTDLNQLILESPNNTAVFQLYGPQKLRNSLVVQRATSSVNAIARMMNGASAYNVTFASVGGQASSGLYGAYSGGTVKNCAIFNVASVYASGSPPSFTNCFTDVASPPSGCTTTAFGTSTGAKAFGRM